MSGMSAVNNNRRTAGASRLALGELGEVEMERREEEEGLEGGLGGERLPLLGARPGRRRRRRVSRARGGRAAGVRFAVAVDLVPAKERGVKGERARREGESDQCDVTHSL